jgi:hypothetical protein
MSSRRHRLRETTTHVPNKPRIDEGAGGGLSPENPFTRNAVPVNPSPPPGSPNTSGSGGNAPPPNPGGGSSGKQ